MWCWVWFLILKTFRSGHIGNPGLRAWAVLFQSYCQSKSVKISLFVHILSLFPYWPTLWLCFLSWIQQKTEIHPRSSILSVRSTERLFAFVFKLRWQLILSCTGQETGHLAFGGHITVVLPQGFLWRQGLRLVHSFWSALPAHNVLGSQFP